MEGDLAVKTLVPLLLLLLLVPAAAISQDARIAAAYSYPLLPGSAMDSVLWGSTHVRGCNFSPDADGDGQAEIAIAGYYGGYGRILVFTVAGNDSIEMVWTSPPAVVGGGSTPRHVVFGDLDNDGRQEVIYQTSGDGIYIFEWDGVLGSHNFGTQPSQVIGSPPLLALGGSTELLEVDDVDGDGQPELLFSFNGPGSTDTYYIISAVGGWETGDPGFSSFQVEFVRSRSELVTYGGSAGTPYGMMPVDFDGQGNKEILLQVWNLKNVIPMTVPAADTYQLADTTNGKQNIYITGPEDDFVALLGGMTYDIDNDGREEVYLPTWYGQAVTGQSTQIHMVFYDPGSSPTEIDTTNVRAFDLRSVIGDPDPLQVYSANTLGCGYGDLDGNGKENLYFSGIYFGDTGFNIVSMEYQGGDKRDPANWTLSMVYRGDPEVLTAITIKDSLGTMDTTTTPWAAQVAHMFGKDTDFDKDGKQDLLLPMQGWDDAHCDSITVTTRTWNQGTSQYDEVVSKIANPKRWVFRVLEGTGTTAVELKDLTVITPEDFVLHGNYPNPFNPSTTIRFALPISKKVSLVVYDMLGREVRTLVADQVYQNGTHDVVWDGTNNGNQPVASGNYIYTLRFGNYTKSGKMTLLK